MTESSEKKALIVVDHGSKRAAANELLEVVIEQVKTLSAGKYIAVEAAHMELAAPTLEDAFARCLAAGAEAIVVSLFFLSPGRHASADIPRMVEQQRQKYPHLRVEMTGPLAPDTRLAQILLDRAEESL